MLKDLHAICIYFLFIADVFICVFFSETQGQLTEGYLIYVNNCDIYNELHNHFRE